MLGPHTHRDNPVSRIMCAPVAPPVTVCKHLKIQKKIGPFFVFPKKKIIPRAKMGKRSDKTNTGEGGKGKKVVTFFKSSTIKRSELAKVQEDLYGNKL